MVGALLTLVTLSVLQLGFSMHIRNTVLDAAADGARVASLAGNSPADGANRTIALISEAIGADYAQGVTAGEVSWLGQSSSEVTVSCPLPVFGLIGLAHGLEVTGHAALETLG